MSPLCHPHFVPKFSANFVTTHIVKVGNFKNPKKAGSDTPANLLWARYAHCVFSCECTSIPYLRRGTMTKTWNTPVHGGFCSNHNQGILSCNLLKTVVSKLSPGGHYITFYLADAFIQRNLQSSANQGHITNSRTCHIRYNSYGLGCKVMNIWPVHKVDRPSQTTLQYGTTVPRQI